jgi:hypothetical protein
MYLNFFFIHKGYFLLHDKTYPVSLSFCFNVLNFLHLEVLQAKSSKRVELVGFLLLNLLSSGLNKKISSYYTFRCSGTTIFSFIANLVTVWLPLSSSLKESPVVKEFSIYTLKSFPLLDEFEILFELNSSFITLVKSLRVKLCFTSNSFHSTFFKESFLRFIKLPLKLS